MSAWFLCLLPPSCSDILSPENDKVVQRVSGVPFLLVFFSLVLLFPCLEGCAPAATGRSLPENSLKLSRLVVLPFGWPGRLDDDSFLLQRELAVRLRMKGYEVSSCREVNTVLGVDRSRRRGRFVPEELWPEIRQRFQPDAVIMGEGEISKIDVIMGEGEISKIDVALIESTRIEVVITFRDPADYGKILLGPFPAEVSENDLTSLQIVGDALTGNLVGAGFKALFYVNKKISGNGDASPRQRLQRLLSYAAFRMVDAVPPGAGGVQIPQFLQVVLNGGRVYRGQRYFGRNDRLELTLLIEDRNFRSLAGSSFRVYLRSRGGKKLGKPFSLVSDDEAGRRWKGRSAPLSAGIDDPETRLDVEFTAAGGQKYDLGTAAVVDIDTKKPGIEIFWWCRGGRVRFLCRTDASPGTLEVEKRRGRHWQAAELEKSGYVYSFAARTGDEFRCRVSSRHGVEVYAPEAPATGARVPGNGRVFDGLCRVFIISPGPCNSFRRLASDIYRVVHGAVVKVESVSALAWESGTRVRDDSRVFCLQRDRARDGFGFELRKADGGDLVYRSHYPYGCGRDDGRLGNEDRRNIIRRVGGSVPTSLSGKRPLPVETSPPFPPNPASSPMLSLMSLRDAENYCRRKNSRLMTEEEWRAGLTGYDRPNRKGEYVQGGFMRYDDRSRTWLFERVFQPQAQNRYRVRCLDDDRK